MEPKIFAIFGVKITKMAITRKICMAEGGVHQGLLKLHHITHLLSHSRRFLDLTILTYVHSKLTPLNYQTCTLGEKFQNFKIAIMATFCDEMTPMGPL